MTGTARGTEILTVERAPRWSVQLRAVEPRLHVREARSLALATDKLATDALAAGGSSWVVLAVDDFSPASAWEWLVATSRRPNPPTVVAALSPNAAAGDAVWAWLQAGAAWVVTSPLETRGLVRMALRSPQNRVRAAPVAASRD